MWEDQPPREDAGTNGTEDWGRDNTRWRSVMLTAVICLSDVHFQLMAILEEILWKSSPENPSASTKAHTSQTRPPHSG